MGLRQNQIYTYYYIAYRKQIIGERKGEGIPVTGTPGMEQNANCGSQSDLTGRSDWVVIALYTSFSRMIFLVPITITLLQLGDEILNP